MKFPKKHSPLLFAFLMSIVLPLIMTFFIVLINTGLTANFLIIWMKAYGIAFIIAFPAILFIAPFIRKFVEQITE